MSDLIKRARHLRRTIESLTTNLDDEDALDNVELFASWSGNGISYTIGDRVKYNEVLYKVLQNHTSQEGWTPESAPSLFAKVLIPTPDIPVWEQPSSTNPYMKGDKVHYPTIDSPIYESLVDNNVWVPEGNPTLWKLVDGETDDQDVEPTPDPEPSEDISEWVQPDSTNPYMAGDKVTHNGSIWISLVDNNVWEPSASVPTLWEEVIE